MRALIGFDRGVSSLWAAVIPHNALFDAIFSFFSLLGGSIYFWLIIVAVLFIFEEVRNHWFIIHFIFAFGSATLLTNEVLKNMVGRTRPFLEYGMQQKFCPSDFSFPSGHATSAFAAATILSAYDKKRAWIYYAGAVLISYSRIYLYCHYLLDVVAGALIGYLISSLVLKISFVKKKKVR
ncbi:phosphatase PAP2 family protein [Candidatus Roizmanbacteria bacterium CG_4_10_14_0_8_um_filter_39_9]|uniref:Phosphatase PAP2 family protein n=1 Tax=Candidatus Roizmanbacteria bacterium CG_4_10_14_0_8_um_filter_39_9 TaxID=1974829 RepID=A0A2M7QC82_9BACT|nr:MAG: phosphatase PAP2 family protein [Candidatus Roizmanbacteria bacterium CG_4_10_14_0_8_um_filter_39_9]